MIIYPKLVKAAKIFITAFLQIFFVGINVIFIAHNNEYGSSLMAGLIAILWLYNVKRAAFEDLLTKIAYVTGSAAGNFMAVVLFNYLKKLL